MAVHALRCVAAVALVVAAVSAGKAAEGRVEDRILDADKTVVECQGAEMYRKQAMCMPTECGTRHVRGFFGGESADVLKRVAIKGLSLGKANGPASIVDLHQGVVSHGDSFINYHLKAASLQKHADLQPLLLTRAELDHLRDHIAMLKDFVQDEFEVEKVEGEVPELFLATPVFFSQLTDGKPRNVHDEYWHSHIDTEQYGSFAFTTLSYLTTQNDSFEGGNLVIDDIPLHPEVGTVVAFTSGAENPHNVEQVTRGTRYTLTVAFTCAPPPVGVRLEEAFSSVPLREDSQGGSTETEKAESGGGEPAKDAEL